MTLISDDYRAQQEQMHTKEYGGTNSLSYADYLLHCIQEDGPATILDYGAGKGHLGQEIYRAGYLGRYEPYDPGVAEFSTPPEPAEFVACIDVLEHIEPECLDAVLDDLKRLTKRRGVFSVHCRPAMKSLPDGRNAHLIQQPPTWWLEQIERRFTVLKWEETMAKKDGELLGGIYRVEARP